MTDEELEAIALESTRTIDIDTFVPKKEIDQLYNIRPYYIAPEGKIGIDAFAVIRDVIEETDKVALGRVVLTSREHVIALEPRGKGLMGTLLRYPYEMRDEAEYFDDIPAGHVTKEMLDIAKHIVQTKPQNKIKITGYLFRVLTPTFPRSTAPKHGTPLTERPVVLPLTEQGESNMADGSTYISFSDECRRLARKQVDPHDGRLLMRMAEAWLAVAELAHLHTGNGGDGS